jgi:molybdopterin synthase catalytic subunit
MSEPPTRIRFFPDEKESAMSRKRPPLEEWRDDIKSCPAGSQIGVFFTHNGVVRATSRDGSAVARMEVSCDNGRLDEVIAQVEAMPGVIGARAWVNEGALAVGDDIVWALVAGDIRPNVFRAWETLSRCIKHEVTTQREIVESGVH